MLGNKNANAVLAVRDLNRARNFYQEILGLSPVSTEDEEAIEFESGDTSLLVYRSEFAGTNQATAVSFKVGDELEEIVRALKDRGVTFEHYDLPGMSRQEDIHAAGDFKVAWFKDPDGNILCISTE